jgi:acetyl-CoA C-acetyltransferase
MPDALIIDAVRTPRGVGKPGKGALAHLHPQHLASTVLKALVDRNGFDTGDVDDVVWGTSSQVNEQSGDLGRMAALDAGYNVTASGATLDRFCGSGITSANYAAHAVMAGMEDLVISGGTEMMSMPKKGLPARHPSAIAPGRLRRCHCDTRKDFPHRSGRAIG